MSDKQINLLQGTLDLLILKVVALEEMHGLGISHRIKQVTKGTFQVKPGSLFPALHRLEQAGWLFSRPPLPIMWNATFSASRKQAG